MTNNEHENQRSAGIRIEDSEDVFVGNNYIDGFDDGISVATTKNFRASGNTIKTNEISDKDLENIKNEIRKELNSLEEVIEDLKGQKDPNVWKKSLEKLSPIAGAIVISYLKSLGYIE